MASNYPASLDTLNNPAASDVLSSPSHSTQHTNANDILEAIETTLGTNSGTSVLKHFTAGQFPIRATGVAATGTLQQTVVGGTLNNNTIGTPLSTGGSVNNANLGTPTITVSSDATGDLLYRSATGILARLAIGAANTVLRTNGTTPDWRPGRLIVGSSQGTADGATTSTTGVPFAGGTVTLALGAGTYTVIGINTFTGDGNNASDYIGVQTVVNNGTQGKVVARITADGYLHNLTSIGIGTGLTGNIVIKGEYMRHSGAGTVRSNNQLCWIWGIAIPE